MAFDLFPAPVRRWTGSGPEPNLYGSTTGTHPVPPSRCNDAKFSVQVRALSTPSAFARERNNVTAHMLRLFGSSASSKVLLEYVSRVQKVKR
jgi:hypothetical protein